jgi:hypothetical protein
VRIERRRRAQAITTAAIVVRWSGRVAFVLAVAVGGGWAVSLILTSLAARPLAPESASILSTIGGVLAGGIAAYLGNTSQRDPNDRTRATDDPHPPTGSSSSTTSSSRSSEDSHNGLSTTPDEPA